MGLGQRCQRCGSVHSVKTVCTCGLFDYFNVKEVPTTRGNETAYAEFERVLKEMKNDQRCTR